MPKVRITETALRDAHQSLIATRMRTEDMLPVIEYMDNAGYWALEMWGGATFDSAMRFLENSKSVFITDVMDDLRRQNYCFSLI